LRRRTALVDVVPGMIAKQHAGGGKANQYFLRGMNLDHGSDFSIQFESREVRLKVEYRFQ
jgi:hypothetical protein